MLGEVRIRYTKVRFLARVEREDRKKTRLTHAVQSLGDPPRADRLSDIEGQRVQGPKCPVLKAQVPSTCGDRDPVLPAPAELEAVAAPVPPAAVPVQAPHKQAAARAAILGAEEVDVTSTAVFIRLPRLGDELGIREQVVKHVRVQARLVRKPLLQLSALDRPAVLLFLFLVEQDLRRIERVQAAFLVTLEPPAVRDERRGVAVDDVGHDLDLRTIVSPRSEHTKCIRILCEITPVCLGKTSLFASQTKFVHHFENREFGFRRHFFILFHVPTTPCIRGIVGDCRAVMPPVGTHLAFQQEQQTTKNIS